MANMSYCRFENTSKDMLDCLEALDNQETNDLSHYEIKGLRDLLQYAKDIVELEDEIEGILEARKRI